jgi:hypothetical protein
MNRHKQHFTCTTTIASVLVLIFGLAQAGLAQTGTNPLTIFKNYFVTGDYVVAGWVEGSSNGTYATGTIAFPDPKIPAQGGLPTQVPTGADIVAAYLYWGTVEGNKSTFQGQQALFNGYQIVGNVLGNAFAPTSWSSGGCTGGSDTGSKTIRFYRADVRPYLPVDTDPASSTFGAFLPNGPYQVQLADSGSNGNTQPNALGATLVIIYRVLNPPTTLNAVVLYDGSYAPSNNAPNVSQTMMGFYQPNLNPTAKLTHIVANGQPNKGETVSFGLDPNNFGPNNVLPSLYTAIYGATAPPFPGLYGGMWDNPTWSVGGLMTGGISGFDTSETTTVVPASTGSGCVNWGAIILSTTVQDSDGDGLLDVWETNQGYTDAVSGNSVALPGAFPVDHKDIFVELDYLVNYLADGVTVQHSHLPKQAALDAVGSAFSAKGINVHFDVGNVYQSDPPLIISNGTGGNAIPESALLCTDGATLCAFPGQPAVAWKGGFGFVRDAPAPLGNFQPGRGQSYHYVLSGHSLGEPRSFWSTYIADLGNPALPQLLSIVNSGTTATVTLQTPLVLSPPIPPTLVNVPVYLKPGDCPNALITACSDVNNGRVTITGALLAPFVPGPNPQPAPPLNGTYTFSNVSSSTSNNVTTTTFTITTSGVPDGTYNFSNEPQLAVAYLGPTSSSGHSDFGGGGDSAITLGLWGADDPINLNTGLPNCQADPSQALGAYPAYCNNQVGTTAQQTGTLLHELGHTLTLTHGGTYYLDPLTNPSLPTYEINCKSNFLSVMNYLFQVRGFVDDNPFKFDYSGQTMPSLNEAYPSLSESLGIGGSNPFVLAAHLTRWYSTPNALDTQLQNTTGGRYAKSHCDGSALTSTDVAGVRVDGTVAPGGNFSASLDFNNDLIFPDPISSPGVDLNYNGILNIDAAKGDPPFSGFNDWQIVSNGVALQQISARGNAFGFSGGGLKPGPNSGLKPGPNSGIDDDGGSGLKPGPNSGLKPGPNSGVKPGANSGLDQDEDTANSTVDPPSGLTCSIPLNNVPGCVSSTPPLFVENSKMVPLSWTYPGSTQIRFAYVYRAVGSFPTSQSVKTNFSKFTLIKTLSGSPPATTYIDPNVKNQTTYTYVLTDKNKQGALSGTSTPLVVLVKF